MRGLDLSEEYFFTYGLPMLNTLFPEVSGRIAAGFAGPGSECFGFDDVISRDHDWGPAFCLWLEEDDYFLLAEPLQKAYDELPKTFKNFKQRVVTAGENYRSGVCSTKSFYLRHTGLDHAPAKLGEWLKIPEEALAVCTNGKVFYDPMGKFSEWRKKLLGYYPEDVRLRRIVSRCMTAAQSGQYNFPRSVKRGDIFAISQSEAIFCHDVISLVFLLNKKYAPFYKWMHRAVRDLEILGKFTYETITSLLSEPDYRKKIVIIESISSEIIKELTDEGLTDSSSDFLLDHGPVINKKIKDETIRKNFIIIK